MQEMVASRRFPKKLRPLSTILPSKQPIKHLETSNQHPKQFCPKITYSKGKQSLRWMKKGIPLLSYLL